MIELDALIVVLLIIGLAWGTYALVRRAVGNEEKRLELPSKTANDMARLIETGLADPVYRQSDEWERRAKRLVHEHYGDDE
jgi:hypothetical protein